jgi:3-oxoacyl-[acyl-carrier-protein] synthase II
MSTTRRVVVTGVGMVTPLGNTLAETMAAVRSGRCAIAPPSIFDASGFDEPRAGEVRGFNARDHFRVPKALKLANRTTRFAVGAAGMALAHAKWTDDERELERLGVVLGTGGADMQVRDLARALGPDPGMRNVTNVARFAERILSGLNPLWLLIDLSNMSSAHVAIQAGARGPNSTVMTDWVAGSQAIGEGALWIRNDEVDVVLAGGADTGVFALAYGAFTQAGLLARPRDDGSPAFVPAEGAALLVLEELEHAQRRGAGVLGEVRGYAATSGPVVVPPEAEAALARAMRQALDDASWQPDDVQEIATASVFAPPYLAHERAAIAQVLGRHAGQIEQLEIKSRMGHSLAASGAIDAAVAVTRGGEEVRKVVCNSLGYSGQAVCLALTAGGAAGRDGGDL